MFARAGEVDLLVANAGVDHEHAASWEITPRRCGACNDPGLSPRARRDRPPAADRAAATPLTGAAPTTCASAKAR